MFGPKITTVFKSRWNALIWAAGILMTAYCSVPSADQTKAEKAGQEHAQPHIPWIKGQKHPHSHVNPWAKG
jgi:hypothetical protein